MKPLQIVLSGLILAACSCVRTPDEPFPGAREAARGEPAYERLVLSKTPADQLSFLLFCAREFAPPNSSCVGLLASNPSYFLLAELNARLGSEKDSFNIESYLALLFRIKPVTILCEQPGLTDKMGEAVKSLDPRYVGEWLEEASSIERRCAAGIK